MIQGFSHSFLMISAIKDEPVSEIMGSKRSLIPLLYFVQLIIVSNKIQSPHFRNVLAHLSHINIMRSYHAALAKHLKFLHKNMCFVKFLFIQNDSQFPEMWNNKSQIAVDLAHISEFALQTFRSRMLKNKTKDMKTENQCLIQGIQYVDYDILINS